MHKIVLSGVAAVGFLAVALTVFAPTAVRQPDAKPVQVAIMLFAPADSGTG